jgi:hypothetical protein
MNCRYHYAGKSLSLVKGMNAKSLSWPVLLSVQYGLRGKFFQICPRVRTRVLTQLSHIFSLVSWQ